MVATDTVIRDSCIFAVFCCVCACFLKKIKIRLGLIIEEHGHTGNISVKQTT